MGTYFRITTLEKKKKNHHFVISKFVSNFGLVFLKCLPGSLVRIWSFVNIHRYEEGGLWKPFWYQIVRLEVS